MGFDGYDYSEPSRSCQPLAERAREQDTGLRLGDRRAPVLGEPVLSLGTQHVGDERLGELLVALAHSGDRQKATILTASGISMRGTASPTTCRDEAAAS